MPHMDLNADLGESFGHYRLPDEALLDLLTSANIACGYHAGDPLVMRRVVTAAAARGVAIGAHPGYPDLQGFGRRELAASPEEIEAFVLYQLGALAGICSAAGTRVRYLKPHGALYHRAAKDPAAAEAIARAIQAFNPTLPLLGLPGTELPAAAARIGIPSAAEAFVDRGYLPDGTLVPRGQPGAMVEDPIVCADRAARMVLDGVVEAVDGSRIPISPDSLCVH
ncbi:MAG: 5-oxoprolinase subunit PxpA, partial [Gemmatimonadota bacterium]